MFLDNIGTIFFSFIGLVIASLVRSHYGTVNKNHIRDIIEEESMLDPMELHELRQANAAIIDIPMFHIIRNDLINVAHQRRRQQQASTNHTPSDSMNATLMLTYDEVVATVLGTLTREKGRDNGTIQLGHLLDRVVLGAYERRGLLLSSSQEMSLSFWCVVLLMTVQCPVQDRIRLLYDSIIVPSYSDDPLATEPNNNILLPNAQDDHNDMMTGQDDDDDAKVVVHVDDVIEIVGYLQDTCQLAPDAQVIMTPVQYPIQQYERGQPNQLVVWKQKEEEQHQLEKKDDTKRTSGSNVLPLTSSASSLSSKPETTPKYNNDRIDFDAFASILRTKSVCAWGECYNRKR
jgi:hypothetical protein